MVLETSRLAERLRISCFFARDAGGSIPVFARDGREKLKNTVRGLYEGINLRLRICTTLSITVLSE